MCNTNVMGSAIPINTQTKKNELNENQILNKV